MSHPVWCIFDLAGAAFFLVWPAQGVRSVERPVLAVVMFAFAIFELAKVGP